jgi:hypothetical protein
VKLKTLHRVLKDGYEDRGVFEPEEKFWKAVKEVIEMLNRKNGKKNSPEELPRRQRRNLGNR